MTFGNPQVGQEPSDGLGNHGRAAISVKWSALATPAFATLPRPRCSHRHHPHAPSSALPRPRSLSGPHSVAKSWPALARTDLPMEVWREYGGIDTKARQRRCLRLNLKPRPTNERQITNCNLHMGLVEEIRSRIQRGPLLKCRSDGANRPS